MLENATELEIVRFKANNALIITVFSTLNGTLYLVIF